jgi:antitoxin component YwqK of YwqJK toxin-antitoxin module
VGAGLFAQPLNQVDDKGRKQGAWKKYYESNKALFYEGQFKDDKQVGTFKHYFKNGKLRSVTKYDVDTARAEVFNMQGRLIAKGKFVDQKKDSIWVYFNNHGKISQKESYYSGVKTGLEQTYYPNGEIASEIEYINDMENGEFVMYYANGIIENEGDYLDGRYDGNFIYYFDNGKKMFEGEYVKGLKNGHWVYYQSDGKIKMFINYNMGKTINEDYQNGEFIIYFDSGMPESIGHYKDGNKNGYFAEYYNNGTRELRPREKDDPYQPDEMEEVIIGQQVKTKKTYLNNKLEGDVLYYSEDGKLLKTESYKNGVLISK